LTQPYYAAEGLIVSLGVENNVQDNVYLLANDTDLRFENMVSVAHQAVIENSTVGDFTFFGFRGRTRNAVIEEGAMIMHNTTVEYVTIPADRITPMGARITTQEQADALPVAWKSEAVGGRTKLGGKALPGDLLGLARRGQNQKSDGSESSMSSSSGRGSRGW